MTDFLPIIAGLAALLAGGAKFLLDGSQQRNLAETKIVIGDRSIQVNGSMSKEELASVVEALLKRS